MLSSVQLVMTFTKKNQKECFKKTVQSYGITSLTKDINANHLKMRYA